MSSTTIQGKSEEGEAPMREALAIFKKVLGEEHPNVATLLNNIAGLLSDQVRIHRASHCVGFWQAKISELGET